MAIKIKNKKSFTLIELLVTMAVGLILLNFAFSFQFNFVDKIVELKKKETNAMESFKLTELIARGFWGQKGLIVDIADINSSIDIDGNYTIFKNTSSNYKYKKIKINTKPTIQFVKDMNNNNANGIFLINIDTALNPNYQKLVYTK
jgi:prepilin-type N-terminal cleavage/methylation domain-containing protein